jgi:hypothetical protein
MTRELLILPLRVRVGNVSYLLGDRQSVIKFAEEHFTKRSWLERRYTSFRLVDESHPDRCRH